MLKFFKYRKEKTNALKVEPIGVGKETVGTRSKKKVIKEVRKGMIKFNFASLYKQEKVRYIPMNNVMEEAQTVNSP